MSKKLTEKKGNSAGRKTTTARKPRGIIVTAHGDLEVEGTNDKPRRVRRNPATKKKKKELTADEMLLRAWKKSYENRHKRLDV